MSTERQLIPVAAWLLLILSCLGVISSRGSILSDISLFLPEAVSPKEELLVNELREGPASRLILMAVAGAGEKDLARSSRELAAVLRGSDMFVRVENGESIADREEQGLLFRYRYLIGPAPAATDFSPPGLRAGLTERLHELRSPVSTLLKRLLAKDPTGVMLAVAHSFQGQKQPDRSHGVWFSRDGNRALLLAETRARGFDLDRQEEAVRLIRSEFARSAAGTGMSLLLTGPGVYGVFSRDRIRGESTWLSVLAMILVGGLILVGYRSLRLLVAGVVPIGTGMVAGVTAVIVYYGQIHAVTLAFGITLLGITIDYPIHLFSHMHRDEPPERSLATIWPTLRLGAVTTCLGFMAMMTAGFSGLTQLGLFAVSGLLTAALTTRLVMLPVLTLLGWSGRRATRPGRLEAVVASAGRLRYAAIAAGLGSILYVVLFNTAPWEDDLAAMSPVPASLIAEDRVLRSELGAPEISHMIVLRGSSAEEALQQSEQLEPCLGSLVEDKVLAGYVLPSRFLPSIQQQVERQQNLPDRAGLRANLAAALEGLPFKPHVFDAFVEEVVRSKELPPLSPEDLAGSALGLRIGSQLFESGHGWLAVVPLAGVRDPAAVEAMMVGLAGVSGYAINLREETGRLINRFRESALGRLGLGLLFIAGVLMAGLRSPARAVQVLIPVVLALAVAVALLVASGDRLSLFHLVSLLLVAGITIDYSLFFNRSGDSAGFHAATLHALTICLLSTVAVFGLLALSQIPVLQAIGRTVVFGVVAGYCFSLVLAPSSGCRP